MCCLWGGGAEKGGGERRRGREKGRGEGGSSLVFFWREGGGGCSSLVFVCGEVGGEGERRDGFFSLSLSLSCVLSLSLVLRGVSLLCLFLSIVRCSCFSSLVCFECILL